MALTALKDPSTSLLTTIGASSLTGRDVVAVAPGPRKLDLPSAATIIREHDAHFEAVTRNKGDFSDGLFKRADAWCRRNRLDVSGSNARGAIGFLGFGAGLCFVGYQIFAHGSPTTASLITGAAIALPSFFSGYAAEKVALLSQASTKRALRRQVQLESVQPSIARFRESKGVEAALLGTVLTSWFQRMDERRALSGPARVELMRVKQEIDALPENDRQDAQRLFELTKLVDAKGDVGDGAVQSMVVAIETAAADERSQLASDVVQLLDANRRNVDYLPAHKLHELSVGASRLSA